ncbi:PREDICTED: cytochrome P450 86B1-like [Nelumbo nucifera]|uniref:Cytochrome P450 86B1-like n=1 Tax=Nelumbo nucifera TaxID=4432 RepID=A0A1U8AEE4_NELNU|nr:PREDICTED: cytochrome P450 86B1-like [Nelumbo nucifera]
MPLQQVAAAADPSTHSDTDDKCYQSSSGIPPDKEGGRKLNRSHMLGDDIFTLDDDEWQAHKKIAHIVLASKEFRSFMASVSKKLVGDGLLSLMLQAAKHGNILDLEDVFMKFAFNSAYTTVLGRNPNLLSLSSATNEIAKAIDNGTEGVFHRHIMPRKLWKLLGWLGVGSEGRLARAQQIINHHLLEHISLKREEMRKGVQGSDLIAMYMSSQAQNGESKAYSDLFLRDIALGFLFAGRDSTGTSLTWFLWLVSTTPRMEEKILDELMRLKKKKEAEGVVRDQKQPWVFDSEDLKDLVYFHAAMCESLRLNPPLPLTRRGVIKEDVPPDAEGEDLEEREWELRDTWEIFQQQSTFTV